MKKLIVLCMTVLSLPLFSFSPAESDGAQVLSITDPFRESIEICYDLPDEGNVEITVTSVRSNNTVGEYSDKQGHGTHCAGIACAPDGPGDYLVDFCFEGEHQLFRIHRQ